MHRTILITIPLLIIACGTSDDAGSPTDDLNITQPSTDSALGSDMDFDLQWGGYYACTESDSKLGEYSIMRIIDFNQDAYHAALFQQKFDHIPSIDEVKDLSPFIGHAPIDSKGLFNYDELTLLGGPALVEDDLVGYRMYLEHCEMPNDEIDALIQRIIEFGQEGPMKLSLTLVDDSLMIKER